MMTATNQTVQAVNNHPRYIRITASPVTERYVRPGMVGSVNGGQVKVCGCWFDLNEKWSYVEITHAEFVEGM